MIFPFNKEKYKEKTTMDINYLIIIIITRAQNKCLEANCIKVKIDLNKKWKRVNVFVVKETG